MPRSVPSSYNFNTEPLDPAENQARTLLGTEILDWQRFRYSVNSGTNTTVLLWQPGFTPDRDVKQTYLDLGRSHHETICSLGFMKSTLDAADPTHMDSFKYHVKTFYFHTGCFLDNLARLIYIVADFGRSPTEVNYRGIHQRRFIDWGILKGLQSRTSLSLYKADIKHTRIKEIINVRNCITHSWQPVFERNKTSGRRDWPKAVRYKRDFYWPYDVTELPRVRQEYRGKLDVLTMMEEDFDWLNKLQKRTFKRLKSDFRHFENHHGFRVGN